MTTKADVRIAVRRRLEDLAVAGLWSDAALDDAMSDALAHYSAIVPREERTTVTVGSGVRSFLVPGLERSSAIRWVIDPAGRVIEPGSVEAEHDPGQGWRWWAGAIWLAKPAQGGNWIVEWLRPRLLPALDSDQMPVLAGDESAVIVLAAAAAVHRRAIEEAKRGSPVADLLLQIAREWQTAGIAQMRNLHRRVTAFIAGTR